MALSLFRFKRFSKTIGIEGENLWISNTNELDFFKDEAERQINGKAQYCFLSLPSLKSGTKSNHTADVVSIFPYSLKNGKMKIETRHHIMN